MRLLAQAELHILAKGNKNSGCNPASARKAGNKCGRPPGNKKAKKAKPGSKPGVKVTPKKLGSMHVLGRWAPKDLPDNYSGRIRLQEKAIEKIKEIIKKFPEFGEGHLRDPVRGMEIRGPDRTSRLSKMTRSVKEGPAISKGGGEIGKGGWHQDGISPHKRDSGYMLLWSNKATTEFKELKTGKTRRPKAGSWIVMKNTDFIHRSSRATKGRWFLRFLL